MRSWRSRSGRWKLALSAIVIAAAAIAAVGLTRGSDPKQATDEPVRAAETGGVADADVDLLELGDVARISGNYRVAVSDITVYEGGESQLLAATVEAEYLGNDEGEPWADLVVEYSAPGAKASGESGCPAGVGEPAGDESLDTGEKQIYTACIPLPADEIATGRVSVEEAFASGDRAYWATKGAEMEDLPSPPPTASAPVATAQPQAPPPAANRSDDDDDAPEYDEEDLEEYDEWVEDMDQRMEDYEKLEDHDEDKVEEWEEWKEKYDEQREQRDGD